MTHAGGIVREARRPPGWCAPGPPAAGPGARADLWPGEGEDLCYLTGDWRIFQRLDGHRWSLDDLVTAWYGAEAVATRGVSRHADIGCGIGSVLMMIAWRFPAASSMGVEAQTLSAGLARRSVAYNGAEARVEVRDGDLRDPESLPAGVFDLVTGTPPYIPIGHGTVSDKEQCGPCRHEMRGGIEDYCLAAARLMSADGRFAVCESAPQVERVGRAAEAAGLTILRRRDVVPRVGRQALFSVYVMARGGGPSMVEPPLVVRDRDGARMPDYAGVRAAMGMPP